MSSYSLFLDAFGIDDPDKEMSKEKSDLVYRSKLLDDLEQIASQRADYYTSGTAATTKLQIANVNAKLKAVKIYADTQVAIEKITSSERSKAISDLSRAASRLQDSAIRIKKSITPRGGLITQIVTAGSAAGKTPAMIVQEFTANPFDDQTGLRLSDEKLYPTLVELGKRTGIFRIDGANVRFDPKIEGTETAAALTRLVKTTYPNYKIAEDRLNRTINTEQSLKEGVSQLQRNEDPDSVRANIVAQTGANLSTLTASIGDAAALREERDLLLKDDAAIKGLDDVQKRIEQELDRASGVADQSRIKKIIANPKFRLWAEMHGYNIGTVDEDGNYIPNELVDKGAVLHFGLQQRTGFDFRVNRKGRTVRLKDEGAFTVDPLNDADVSEAEREVVQGLRDGSIQALQADKGMIVFVGAKDGTYTISRPTDDGVEYKKLPEEETKGLKLQLEGNNNIGKSLAAGKTQADALLQKYPVTQEVGEQEYREITPNARDIQRGKVRLQSLTTGEIVERDIDGYSGSIEVIESMPAGPGDVVRAARDARLERQGKRAAGIELTEEEDLDPTGDELASMRRREGEAGLQDQLDEARNELEAAQSEYLGTDLQVDLRSTDEAVREKAARVLRAQESIRQLDAKIEDSLAKAGTRAEEAVGDEPDIDVPVLDTEAAARPEQLEGETGAELLEASARQLTEPVPEGERPESPVADVPLLDVETIQPTTTGIAARTKAADKTGTRDPSYQTKFQQFLQRLRQLRAGPENIMPEENIKLRGRERGEDQQSRGEATVTVPDRLDYTRDYPEPMLKDAEGKPLMDAADKAELEKLGVRLTEEQVSQALRSGKRPAPYLKQDFVPQPRLTAEVYNKLRARKKRGEEDEDFRLEGDVKVPELTESDFGLPEGAMRTGSFDPEQRERMASGITEEGLKRLRRIDSMRSSQGKKSEARE